MGVSAASMLFEAWGWLFREQPNWLGHVLPVVIILYNPETDQLFWQQAQASLVQLTREEGKLLIPRSNVLDRSGAGRDSLRKIVREFRQADPLASSLPLLPPSAARVLRDSAARPENTMMAAWQLAEGRHQPDLTAASLLAGQPSWLSDGGGDFEAAIGAYANDHGHPEIARGAFEQAAAYDRADRDRLLSIAALIALGQSDTQGAEADLARAGAADGLLPRVARAALADHARQAGPGDPSKVHQLLQDLDPAGLAGAGGAALEREAAYGEVAVLAAQAAAAMKNREFAASFAAQTTDPAAAAYIGAVAADPSAGPAALGAAWRNALAAAATQEQTRRALYELAAVGQLTRADIAIAEDRGSTEARAVTVLMARNDAANGRVDPAVAALRELRDSYSPAAEVLIEVLARAGRTDDALQESDLAIARFGDNTFAANKLNMLARAGRQQEAEAYATSLLASPSALAPEQRSRVRQVLIGNRVRAGDYAAAERLSKDGLAESPDDADFACALITALANQGHMDQAIASYQYLRPALGSPELVPLWLDLLSRRNVTNADVEVALNAAEQWSGSVAARRLIEGTVAMIAALPQSGSRPQLSAGISPQNLARLAASLRQG